MQIGVVFPQAEIGDNLETIRDYAQAVESLGYKHILVYECVTSDRPYHEPFVLFGLLAALTKRIELTTGILVLPSRPTVLVAKQAAAVDILSGGRLRLGVSVGWNKAEFTAMNAEFSMRGEQIEEQIHLLRSLWTKPKTTYTGRWHQLVDIGINPMPIQRPIPVWMGGEADVVLARIARLADGWITDSSDPFNKIVQDRVMRLKELVTKADRSLDSVGIEAQAGIKIKSGAERDWVNCAMAWKQLGATHLSVKTTEAGFASIQEHLDVLYRLKNLLESEGVSS